jgi:predicted dinucleotide-binding enzyme
MKTYNLRVTKKQIKYCSVTAKSLEEAIAQADYQILVNPATEIDGTIKEIKSYELVELPDKPMVIEPYNEFIKENEDE